MELVRHLGNRLQKTGLGPNPTGAQIGDVYDRKKVAILRSLKPIDIPKFYNLLSIGDMMPNVVSLDDEAEPKEDSTWECLECGQEFLAGARLIHPARCPVSCSAILFKCLCL